MRTRLDHSNSKIAAAATDAESTKPNRMTHANSRRVKGTVEFMAILRGRPYTAFFARR
jgi:hypothetical protein